MRLVIFLLAVANLLFFAWTRGVFGEGAQGTPRAGEPLRAEQTRMQHYVRLPTGELRRQRAQLRCPCQAEAHVALSIAPAPPRARDFGMPD